MITSELVRFIKEQLEKGKTEDDIRQVLLLQGWRDIDVNEGLRAANNPMLNVPIPQANNKELDGVASIGQLLSETGTIYKKNFWRFWLVTLIFGIIALIIAGGLGFGIFKLLLDVNLIVSIIAFLLVGIIFSFIMTAAQISTILVVAHNDNQLSLGQILKTGFKKMLPFWWLGMLASMIIFACVLPGIVLVLLWGLFHITTLLVVGIIIMFVLTLFIGTYLSQTTFIYVLEKERIMNSLLKSRDYIRNNWWKVFGRIILFGIVWLVILWLLSWILNTFLSEDITNTITSIIDGLFITPLFLGYTYSLYKSLRDRKRGALVNQKSKNLFVGLIVVGTIVILASIGFMIYVLINPTLIIQFMSSGALKNSSFESFQANNADRSAKDAWIQADLMQLRDVAQMIFIEKGSYKDICKNTNTNTNNDDKTDLEVTYPKLKIENQGTSFYLGSSWLNIQLPEISAINNDLEKNGGYAWCASTQNGYCVCSQLNNALYFCVDNNGVAKSYASPLLTNCGYMDEESTILSHCQ